MRLHVISDLHVEFGAFEPPAVEAERGRAGGSRRGYPHEPVAAFDAGLLVDVG